MSTEKKAAISAVIITHNEQKNIVRCITSLKVVASEIVVVDSFSTDNTVQLAKDLGANVIQHPFEGHIQQKNYAMSCASNHWILSLDADEALSDQLKTSILQLSTLDENKVYSFNRLSNYCGKWIKHCGWYPDVKVRLFNKNSGAWGGKNPHDKFIPQNGKEVSHLKGDLLHYTFYTVAQHKEQIKKFSAISAQAYFEKGIRSNTFKIWFSPVAKFIRNYMVKLGFLDGYKGWLICSLSAKATYLKYVQLKNIQKAQKG